MEEARENTQADGSASWLVGGTASQVAVAKTVRRTPDYGTGPL